MRCTKISTSSNHQKRKKILICSANRAEKGLLQPTVEELKALGADAKLVELPSSLKYLHYISGWGSIFEKEQPDLVVVPCDRVEALACASIAYDLGIPIIHFHAGDLGAGIRDDGIRMAISRLSSIMLCETEEARNFLVQSGEEPWRIHVVGSTAFDRVEIPTKKDLMNRYKLPEDYSVFLYHPDPYASHQGINLVEIYLRYCKSHLLILMYPNGDPGSDEIIAEIESLKNDKRFKIIRSFETRGDFLAAIKYAKQMVGNSSSMYYEAPYFGTPCIQLGIRNKARMKPKQVMDGGSKRIAKILDGLDLTEQGKDNLLRKHFILLEFQLNPRTI